MGAQVGSVPSATQPELRTARRQWTLFTVKRSPYLFIFPFYFIFIVFNLYPILSSFLLSFTNQRGIRPGDFVGLDNYIFLLNDDSFWQAVGNTLKVWVLVVPALAFGSLALAIIVNQRWLAGRYTFRLMIFSPVVVSLVVAGTMFLVLLDPDYGPLARLLAPFGIRGINLTTDQWASIPVIALVTIWRWIGWNMVIMLAALQTIPIEISEAALVDGASSWQRFRYITLPLMRPVIIFIMILSTIGTFNQFDEPFILFGRNAGPGQSALMLGPFIYRTNFDFLNFGYGSAVAYVVTVVVFLASVAQYWISERTRADRD
jgi:lactose/L-arabinose transport system permease protein